MNNKITVKDLENMNSENLRDNFYYLCQENTSQEIEKCFQNKKINPQLNAYLISYGLMGASRSDKIEKAKILLDCVKKYTQVDISTISLSSAINLSLKKNHIEFAHELIEITMCFEKNIKCLMNIDLNTNNNKKAYVAFMLDTSGSMKQSTIVEDKYNKFNVSSFDMYNKDLEKLEWLLTHKIHINHIKNVIQKSCENDNMIPLISIVKSQHLEVLVKDTDFQSFMQHDSFKNIKTEFQHLIDNVLLEKKLQIKLKEKNTKLSTNKI